MNPESSSYGEALHEDSFEYSGDIMLMEGTEISVGEKRYIKHEDFENRGWNQYTWNGRKWDVMLTNSQNLPAGAIALLSEDDLPVGLGYDRSGKFDPTSEDFKQIVEGSGFDYLAEGYGVEKGDFDEFYEAPLVAMKAEYGVGGTLEQGRGLDLATITETQRADTVKWGGVDPITGEQIEGTEQKRAAEGLRAATAGAKIGRRSAGLQAGQAVSDIYAQTSAQQEKGGFGPGGAASATVRRAQRGVMGDYNLQQQQLAEGMTQARSAFDIAQQEITSGQTGVTETARIDKARVDLTGTQAGIDWTAKKADFWKTTEDEFYDQLDFLETQG